MKDRNVIISRAFGSGRHTMGKSGTGTPDIPHYDAEQIQRLAEG